MIEKIISSGQTGVDRAAFDVAIEFGIPHGGGIPIEGKTGDGIFSDEFHLLETTIEYSRLTELNVVDSDGTLIICHHTFTGRSEMTQELARKHGRPCLDIYLGDMGKSKAVEIISSWLDAKEIKTLNVAGPRGSRGLNIYEATKEILRTVVLRNLPQTVGEAVERLISEFPWKERRAIGNMAEDELSALHSSLGIYVRRKLGLWSGNEELMQSCRYVSKKYDIHEDDASALIIRELWKRIRKGPSPKVDKL